MNNVTIEKAIVTKEVSIIQNLDFSTSKTIEKYGGFNKTPRNSYIARRVSNAHDKIATDSDEVLLWPFFSSHISLPLKVGEMVWAIFDRDIKDQGWWITRIHSDEDGEDLSFSCYDRRYLKNLTTKGIVAGLEYDEQAISDAKKAIFSLHLRNDKKVDQLKNIIDLSNSSLKLEPIPKFTKRSGDLVIQGSNNSLICLGTDRYWKKEDTLDGTNAVTKNISPFSGAVDIVAGRARSLALSVDVPKRTASKVYKHKDRDFIEIEKGKLAARYEGDPDFYSDAARLYISMKTSCDEALSLKDYIPVIPGEESQRQFASGSIVFAKADHVRLIARNDRDLGINGTIRIVKEGLIKAENKEESVPLDGCSLNLLEDGTVQISGQKIFLGFSSKDSGLDEILTENEIEGYGQPYIRYQQLRQLFYHLLSHIEMLRTDLDNHIKKYNSHIHDVPPAPSSPVKTLPLTTKSTFKTSKKFIIKEDDTFDKEIKYFDLLESIKSARIFGE